MKESIFEKQIKIIENINNSETEKERNEYLIELKGFRNGISCIDSRLLNLSDCDMYYLNQGIDRPMCCGVWLDWEQK